MLMFLPVILFCKAIMLLLRKLGRNGSALPGLVAEKLYPNILQRTLSQLPQGMIVVTGTNGKTTTTKIIAELLRADDLRVITNQTGSNFVRGIIATIIKSCTLTGRLPYDIAVFEQDEAHAVHLVRKFGPDGVVILNIARDQMDRYGEIDQTAALLGKVVESAKKWVVLNANDQRVAGLQKYSSTNKTYWFGHVQELQSSFISDDQHHHYDDTSFFEAVQPTVMLKRITPKGLTIATASRSISIETALDGSHNAINIVAALTAAIVFKGEFDEKSLKVLSSMQPAFGRGEYIKLNTGGMVRLQLVKNPSGFTHALRLLKDKQYATIGIAINDDYADSRDVSWLWDVDFQSLNAINTPIYCGGSRAYDMALRLKYDGITVVDSRLKLTEFLSGLLHTHPDTRSEVMIFCTYTAMLNLRKYLTRYSNELKKTWV